MTDEEKRQALEEAIAAEAAAKLENNGGEPVKTPDDEPKFTQAQINAMIQDRLERERRKQEEKLAAEKAEAERKRLEENQEFKTLADQYKAELEKIKEDARKSELNSKRQMLLTKAGYNEEQIARYGKFVDGETEDELKEAVEQLKKDVPPTPKYVDPNSGNSSRQTPPPKDKEEKGRTIFQRLKDEGKIRK